MNEKTLAYPAAPPASDWFEVAAARTSFHGNIDDAKALFTTFRAVRVNQIFEPEFLATALRLCAVSKFGPETSNTGFREKELTPQRAGRVLNLALNRPVLLRWLELVTGCAPLQDIAGGLAQTLARPGDQLVWHDDFSEGEQRRLAIVIDLSTQNYAGGNFQLRLRDGKPLFEHHYEQPGSALIFEVSSALEHRVLPLTAGGPRRVFAGWARSSPTRTGAAQ